MLRIPALAAILLLAWGSAALAQLPVPIGTPTDTTGKRASAAGALETAPIAFEGRTLFKIAAPKGTVDGVSRVLLREETIEENLRRIAVPTGVNVLGVGAPRFDADTFRIATGEENGYEMLYATDASGKESPPILTVTEADAEFNGVRSSELAKLWRGILEDALAPSLRARAPEYARARFRTFPLALIAALIFTFICEWLRKILRDKEADIASAEDEIDPRGTSDSQEARRLRVSRTLVHAGVLTLLVAAIAAWVIVALWTLSIIPSTRAFASGLWVRILWIIGIWLAFVVLDNVLNFIIVRLSNDWVPGRAGLAEYSRALLRRPTFVGAACNLKAIVLVLLAIAGTLTALNVSTASALTVSALFGFAITFAAQSIIKDYVTGFLILAEDQFAIGDYVTINGTSGFVENLTLRIVQIRSDDGALVTIANGSILQAQNATSTWSRVDFRIAVTLDSDIDRATAVLQQALDELVRQPRWAADILEQPQVLGVDALTPTSIILRAWIKAAPMERGPLAREINRRVVVAFRESGITLAPGAPAPALGPQNDLLTRR